MEAKRVAFSARLDRSAKWRRRLLHAGLAVTAPLLLLLAAEGVLRLVGYGYPTDFFLKSESGDSYLTNQRFAWQFFSRSTPLKPCLAWLAASKALGTIRICVLGESAAMGTPDPAFGFGRILEEQLHRQYPTQQFEVVNAAMRGINSHVVRGITRECARHQPDVFLVYMGNNEVVGLHGPDPGAPLWAQSLTLIRAGHWLMTTRLGQGFQGMLAQVRRPAPTQDMDYFRAHSLRPDDPRREKNRENFRANLSDILRTATASGAKVIVATLGSNLKDFPPLESLHKADLLPEAKAHWEAAYGAGNDQAAKGQWREAIAKYLEAEAIDDHFAELHFRLAESFLGAGDFGQAKKYYTLARDWDALQFRADSRMNQVIREVAGRDASGAVTLIDFESALCASELSDNGIPGQRLFEDHVHPTFAGNYLLASNFCAVLRSVLPSIRQTAPGPMPTERECAAALAYTRYDEINVRAAMVQMTGRPPFLDQLEHARRQATAEAENRRALGAFNPADAQACLTSYRAALSARPKDWFIHFNLGMFYQELRRHVEAAEEFGVVVNEFPEQKRFRLLLAASLEQAGDRLRCARQLEQALRLDPKDREVAESLEKMRSRGPR